MRLVNGDVNVYYYHDTLTPHNVRAASCGTAGTSAALVPEVGDILHKFPGWTGEEYEPITVRVVSVEMIGDGVEAYEVRTATVPNGAPPSAPKYDSAAAVDDALAAAKARYDHGDAPYDPDVLALIRAAETMRAKLYGPADDLMPVFVIKAKDEFAISAVSAYRRLCEARGLTDQAAQVRLAAAEMSAWRERNPGAVKLPDHQHVPVTG